MTLSNGTKDNENDKTRRELPIDAITLAKHKFVFAAVDKMIECDNWDELWDIRDKYIKDVCYDTAFYPLIFIPKMAESRNEIHNLFAVSMAVINVSYAKTVCYAMGTEKVECLLEQLKMPGKKRGQFLYHVEKYKKIQNVITTEIRYVFDSRTKLFLKRQVVTNSATGAEVLSYDDYYPDYQTMCEATGREIPDEEILNNPFVEKEKRIIKKYDKKDEEFKVLEECENETETLFSSRDFYEFVKYLEGDLSDADLMSYKKLIDLENDEGIKWGNAKIPSVVKDRFGIPYEQVLIKDEILRSPQKEDKDELQTEKYNPENRLTLSQLTSDHIMYISDLHLCHRISVKGLKSWDDIDDFLSDVVSELLSSIGLIHNVFLVFAGDIASDFEVYMHFIEILEKKTSYPVIFTLGNHELWPFEGLPFEEIVKKYDDFLSSKRNMYLLQNRMLAILDSGERIVVDYNDDFSEIKTKYNFRNLRRVFLGGMGFSGLNEGFNASHGLYRTVIDRKREINLSDETEKMYRIVADKLQFKNVTVITHMPPEDWCKNFEPRDGYVYIYGHTHRNRFFDDGVCRVFGDNQVGYSGKKYIFKFISNYNDFDWFADFSDGIHLIDRKNYISFYMGKNIQMQLTQTPYRLYMLKREGKYCFIQETKKGKLYICHGGQKKALPEHPLEYYYENMLRALETIEGATHNFRVYQKKIADIIKKIGGQGWIHGTIIDIDGNNHLYVNPLDLSVTAYNAIDVIDKSVYKNLKSLLFYNRPELYAEYEKLLSGPTDLLPVLYEKEGDILSREVMAYYDTDIYTLSNMLKKTERLDKDILTMWSLSD